MANTNLFRHFGPSRWLRHGEPRLRRSNLVLQAIPPALRAMDTGFEAEWRGGAFALAGHSVPIGTGSPFATTQAPDAWLRALYGFGWLRHVMPHAEADVHAVEGIVWDWLALSRTGHAIAREDGVTARRILSWLAHADLLLQTTDAGFYDAVLKSLAADIYSLERRVSSIEDAQARMLALIALAQAGLCVEGGEALHQAAETALGAEVANHGFSFRLLLRQPDDLADLLLDLEALRLLYGMRGQAVPQSVARAKDAICVVLGGLALDGDRLARLGSPRFSTERGSTMASVARHVSIAPVTSCYNTDAGFVRLVLGETTIIADAGAPYRSVDALALEMCSGSAPCLVHDGLEQRKDETTRGTLIVAAPPGNEADTAPRHRAPTLEPTHSVEVDFDAPKLKSFDAAHAGAALHGHAHRRRVALSEGGRRIDGVDELRPLIGHGAAAGVRFAARFVLHSSVEVTIAASPDQLELALANGHRWRLAVPGRSISVEGAVHRDGLRTVPTLQILVPGDGDGGLSVAWHWLRLDGDADDGLGVS